MYLQALYPCADLRIEEYGGLVFNASGILVELNSEDAAVYAKCIGHCNEIDKLKKDCEHFSVDGLKKLLAAKYLSFIDDGIHHRVIQYQGKPQKGLLNAPISAHIYPSDLCNAKCIFCYNEKKSVSEREIIDVAGIYSTIDYLYEIGVPMINFLGGEPLLYFQELVDFMEYCNHRFFIGFASNGFGDGGFTKERCQRLKKIDNLSVRISLHHSQAKIHDQIVGLNGAFEKAMESVHNLIQAGVHCTWSCLPLKNNIEYFGDMIQIAKKNHMSGFHMLNPHPTDLFGPGHPLWLDQTEKIETIDKILLEDRKDGFEISFSNWYYRLRETKDYYSMCGAGNEIVEIDNKGNCYPCCIVLGNNKYQMGNIHSKTLNIERKSMFNRLNDIVRENETRPPCNDCQYGSVCRGGCPLANQVIYGDNLHYDAECPYIR